VIAKATILVLVLLSLELVRGYINITSICKMNGQEPHHAVPTLSAVLPLVRHPVFAVIVQTETASCRSLIVEAVANKDLEGYRQLFPPKHLL
jgi:hypothetical protein